MTDPVAAALEEGRRALLDLSTRNRLLSLPGRNRSAGVIDIVGEKSEVVFRRLMQEGKALAFAATAEPGTPAAPPRRRRRTAAVAVPALAAEAASAPPPATADQPAPAPDPAGSAAAAAAIDDPPLLLPPEIDPYDLTLQTTLGPEALQRRLLGLYRDSRLFAEEQGLELLFLGLGQLVWTEPAAPATERRAPLLLVPVALERGEARAAFRLRARPADIDDNLSLAERLKVDFGIALPKLPADDEAIEPAAYFAAVAQAIEGRAGWRVEQDAIALGLYSFAKLLMHSDLDPANWPHTARLDTNPFVRALLVEGLPPPEQPMLPDDTDLDELIPVGTLDSVLDADGSQTLAAEEVRRGRSCVVQGPPGTGKSQTITNIIAQAIKDGRSVLFVAEKLAALEVVRRRLEGVGLGAACLPLHSDRTSRRSVLAEIDRTLGLPRPAAVDEQGSLDPDLIINRLGVLRGRLNRHAHALHEQLGSSGISPYRVIGELSKLRAAGVPPPDFAFDTARYWSAEDLRERRAAVLDLVRRLGALGVPAEHAWRGVKIDSLLPTDAERLLQALPALAGLLGQITARAQALATAMLRPAPTTLADARNLAALAEGVAAVPKGDRRALAHPVWQDRFDAIANLVSAAERMGDVRAELGNRVREEAWSDLGLDQARRELASSGASLFGFFNSGLRKARAKLRASVTGPLPDSTDEQIALFDKILVGQGLYATVGNGDDLGRAAFGRIWNGPASDPAALRRVTRWVAMQRSHELAPAALEAAARVADPAAIGRDGAALDADIAALDTDFAAAIEELDLDLETAFGSPALDTISLALLIERIGAWVGQPEGLSAWIEWTRAFHAAREAGLGPLAELLADGRLGLDDAPAAFDRAYHEAMLHEAVKAVPALAVFDGGAHAQLVEDFKIADQRRMELARIATAQAHWQRVQRAQYHPRFAMLRAEIARKRGHMALRRLLHPDMVGAAVQAVKPVFMMSPLSVAQFLEPGGLSFDLLVMDEASQIEPMDAVGAVARAKQIVVVGDDRQLPPTRFFQRLTTEADGEAPAPAGAADIESILGLCAARGLPRAMLRWHYRSKHESLVAVSNAEFYGGRLKVIPAPSEPTPELGVQFRHVPEGVFLDGANRAEAQAVAAAVLEHARTQPERSLGVAAFSVQQRDAIAEEIEALRLAAPDVEPFFAAHADEPFFVKNLETVQGDERDVIFISVGYAPGPDGALAMRFGPVSAQGGERRLNVLITRAKRRCVVFSAITDTDIDLSRTDRSAGEVALQDYLRFARTGALAVPAGAGIEEGGKPSPTAFEQTVRAALEKEGFRVRPQYGLAGFFIDLAVEHPDRPGRYALGIECDGTNYAGARSARDRDRLRESALAMNGWIIHRVWSTDWFQRPEEQLRKVLEAIEAAKEGRRIAPAPMAVSAASPTATAPSVPSRPMAAATIAAVRSAWEGDPAAGPGAGDGGPGSGALDPLAASAAAAAATGEAAAVPYRSAAFEVPKDVRPEDLPFPQLTRIVVRIVTEEGPIHADEVASRVAQLWGLSALTPKGIANVRQALGFGLQLHSLIASGPFYSHEDSKLVVRNRDDAPPTLRRPERLPPAELRAAILAVLGATESASGEEAVLGVARLMGLGFPSPAIRAVIEVQIAQLIAAGAAQEQGELLSRTP